MTIVTTTTSSGPYTAVAQTTFAVTFQSAGDGEIEITLAGVVQSPSLYTFTRAADGTGSVVFTAAVTGQVLIYSKPLFTQDTSFSRFGAFYPDQINSPLDKAAAKLLYLKNLLVPASITPTARASKYLQWDASGNPVAGGDEALVTTRDAAIASVTASGVTAAATATTQAGIATTQATNAATSAASVLTGTMLDDAFKHGGNQFNPATVSLANYIDAAGALAASGGWNTTDFMQVDAGVTYYPNLPSNSGATGIVWFQANKTTVTGTSFNHLAGTAYTAPALSKYARVAFATDALLGITALSRFVFARGSSQPSPLGYGYTDAMDVATRANKAVRNASSKLRNLYRAKATVAGYFIDGTTGTLTANAAYSVSDFMECHPGQKLYISIECAPGNSALGVEFLDRDKVRIAAAAAFNSTCTTAIGSATITVTVATGMLLPGTPIFGSPNIPAGSYIVTAPAGFGTGTYTISQAATVAGSVALYGGGVLANVPFTVPPGAHYVRVPMVNGAEPILEVVDAPRVPGDFCIGWGSVEDSRPWAGRPFCFTGDSIGAGSATGSVGGATPLGPFQTPIQHRLQTNFVFPLGTSGRTMATALNKAVGSLVASDFNATGFTATASTTSASDTLTVTVAGTGTISIGMAVIGTNIPAGTKIAALISGTGGTGTYRMSAAATGTASGTTVTVVSAFANGGLVLIHLGTNSWGVRSGGTYIGGRPLGALGDVGAANTFYGDMYAATQDGFLTFNPKLTIAMASPFPRFDDSVTTGLFVGNPANDLGVRLSTFADAVKAHCDYYGHQHLDLFRRSGLNAKTLGTWFGGGDLLHPLTAYYPEFYVPTVAGFLNGMRTA